MKISKTRETAINWWASLTEPQRETMFNSYKQWGIARQHQDLTGKQIQKIFEVETMLVDPIFCSTPQVSEVDSFNNEIETIHKKYIGKRVLYSNGLWLCTEVVVMEDNSKIAMLSFRDSRATVDIENLIFEKYSVK